MRRPIRSNNETPRSASRASICREAADWLKLRRADARAKPPASATITNVRKWRGFNVQAFLFCNNNETINALDTSSPRAYPLWASIKPVDIGHRALENA